MTRRRHERVFMSVCERLKLNPSRWVPHIKADGLYEIGMGYDSADDMLTPDGRIREGKPVHVPCFSIYSAFETVCRERAKTRLGLDDDRWMTARLGFWYEFWGFLSEVDMGVFDSVSWESAENE